MKRNRLVYINGLLLPITPEKFELKTEHNSQTFETLEVGELVVLGKRKAEKLSFSSFFPDNFYEFSNSYASAYSFVNSIIEMKNLNKPVRVMITGTNINKMFYISSFNYEEKDGTGDIYYSIDFIESREKNIPNANYENSIDSTTGLRGRP